MGSFARIDSGFDLKRRKEYGMVRRKREAQNLSHGPPFELLASGTVPILSRETRDFAPLSEGITGFPLKPKNGPASPRGFAALNEGKRVASGQSRFYHAKRDLRP